MLEVTDERLVDLFLSGNEQAFETIWKRHLYHMRGQLSQSTRKDEALIEDLLQEVAITLIRKLHTWDRRCALSSWIFRVTRNIFLMHKRRENLMRLPPMDLDASWEVVANVVPSEGCPIRDLSNKRSMESLAETLGAYPKTARKVLLLTAIGSDCNGGASALRRTVSSYKSLKLRVMQDFKRREMLEAA